MPEFFAEAFATLLLVGDYFITFNMGNNLGLNSGLYIGTGGKLTVIINQQYIRKIYFITRVATEVGNIQVLIFLNFKLLTGDFYYCKHNLSKIRSAKVGDLDKMRKQKSKILAINSLLQKYAAAHACPSLLFVHTASAESGCHPAKSYYFAALKTTIA
jgi:hypothetical protein